MRILAGGNKGIIRLSAMLIAGLLAACQPPTTEDTAPVAENKDSVDSPIIINTDSVTMSHDYILSIKPSRYQPSLGLQGNIEPIRQIRFSAAQDLTIQKVLVTQGQWVEKGTPLLIVQHRILNDRTVTNTDTNNNQSNDQSTIETDSNQLERAADTPSNSETEGALKANNTENSAPQQTPDSQYNTQLITVRASFSGRVDTLYVEVNQQVDARKPLLHLSDDTDLRFIATLPIQAKPQLSVGQTVNFTTDGSTTKFTGQVSKLQVGNQPNQLLVYVHVIKNEASRGILKPNMAVTGRVNYGQIEVGTIVPKQGIHDVDLSELQKPPYQPLSPLTANVWIIKQDQRLTRQPVEVISYDPSTDQYLIAGISNDSLICLAELPLESAGKKVVIS